MRKRLFALFFASFLTFTAFGAFYTSLAAAGGEAAVIISDAQAIPADIVALSLTVTNNPGICGMRLFVSYDASVMTLDSVLFSSLFGGGAADANIDINPFILLWNLGTANFSGNGVLATLYFKIASSAPDGEYLISATYDGADVFNLEDEDVSLNITNGKITVSTAPETTAAPATTVPETTTAPATTVPATTPATTTAPAETTAPAATTAATTAPAATTAVNTQTKAVTTAPKPEISTDSGDGALLHMALAATCALCLSAIIYKNKKHPE